MLGGRTYVFAYIYIYIYIHIFIYVYIFVGEYCCIIAFNYIKMGVCVYIYIYIYSNGQRVHETCMMDDKHCSHKPSFLNAFLDGNALVSTELVCSSQLQAIAQFTTAKIGENRVLGCCNLSA